MRSATHLIRTAYKQETRKSSPKLIKILLMSASDLVSSCSDSVMGTDEGEGVNHDSTNKRTKRSSGGGGDIISGG